MKRLRLLLVDDQLILLDVLRRRFQADNSFSVVAEARSATDALALAESENPDVVMLDVDLGHGESGFDVAASLRRASVHLRIVMVSMFEHRMYRDRAFEVGADAYVTKGVRFETLRAVLLGRMESVCADEARCCWARPRGNQKSACLTLTGRELDVVQALFAGMREKEAAERLSVSVSSVGTYLRRAMDKMGVATRAELLQTAAALGIEKGKLDGGAS